MTTIAFKNGVIAADCLTVDGHGLRSTTYAKIWRGAEVVIGMAGITSKCLQYLNSLKESDSAELILSNGLNILSGEDDLPHALLVLKRSGTIYIASGKQYIQLEEEYWAIGSGRDFALSAMHFGKTAVEAVKFASDFDVYTGAIVVYVDIHALEYVKRRAF